MAKEKKDPTLEYARGLTPPQMVKEFQTIYKAGYSEEPALPSVDVMRLRCALIFEEAKELQDACAEGDLVEAADALGDLLYVVLGGFATFGIAGLPGQEVMARIHAANLSKLCSSVEEAQKIIDDSTLVDGPIYYYEESKGGTAVLYWATGPKKDKVVKGPHYKAPDLSFLLKTKEDAKA